MSLLQQCYALTCYTVIDWQSSSAAFCHINWTCVVWRTYSNYGDRCFAAAGPKLWNSLPADLRQADISFQRFKLL